MRWSLLLSLFELHCERLQLISC